MKKIFLILMLFLTAFLMVSSVSASDNFTDVVSEVADDSPDVESVEQAVGESVVENTTPETLQTPETDVGKVNESGDVLAVNGGETLGAAKSVSKVSASKTTDYAIFKNKFTVKLTINGKAAPNKRIKITLNGATYKRYTDENGIATLWYRLNRGTYAVSYLFEGDSETSASNGSTKIVLIKPLKSRIQVTDKDINYRQGSKCLFSLKVYDGDGNRIKHRNVVIKVAGKTLNIKTTKNGYANVYLSLKHGTYKIKYAFGEKPYYTSKGTCKIYVRPYMGKGDGYWLWSDEMNSVDLDDLASKGTKQIFLHVHAITVYGKSSVLSFIRSANNHGMKVHMWMQVCYGDGGWVSPVRDDGSFKMAFMNQKISEAVEYAQMKGVAGVHMDYVRYGGTAHNHINAVESINYFVKKASLAVHKVRPNSIVSVAVMPEPSAMIYYYGQDISTMSKYVDMILPMVYKGNYGQPRGWIQSVTSEFVKQSNGAQIWTGLQSYRSDDDVTPLSHDELLKDAKAAKAGGAKGIILFKLGLSHYLNFNKV